MSSNILSWVCWALWTARNTLIFEKRFLTPQRRETPPSEWVDESTMTCMSDAAYDSTSKRAGLAWILKDSSGTHLHQDSSVSDLTVSPLVAEALALRAGLISAVKLKPTKLRMLSDNLTLIRAINNDTQIKEIFGIVHDIQHIASVPVEITFKHISRSSNTEADCIAKTTLSVSLVSNPLVG